MLSGMKPGIVLIFAAAYLAAGQRRPPPAEGFVTRKDRDLARQAQNKVEAACDESIKIEELTEDDYKARREDLEMASAGNVVLTVLQEADSPEAMNQAMTDELLNPSFLLFQAGPLIGFIFFLVLYVLYFCWACCPCCWCRCCQRRRNCPKVVKFIFLILFAVIILGLVIAASLSIRGFNAASSGFKLTQCTAAQLVNDTMGGSTEQNFLGVIRTLEIFQELKESLDPGSRFLTDLEGILTNTKPISEAVVVASATMTNLKLMMEDPLNVNPTSDGTATGVDLLHSCELCTILAPQLTSAISALNGGVGSALASTRETVAEQLQGENLGKLSDSMLSGTAPLVELKTVIHSAFGPFVEEDTLEAITVQLDNVGTLSSVALIGVALLLALCSILTGVCWICVDKHTAADGTSQHRRITCRCAMCTWCCGCYYMLFVLLISGIMTAVSIPLASICLVLEDVNGPLIRDIAEPLQLNISGPEGQMMIDMVTKCFRNEDPRAQTKILDLITVPSNTSADGTMTMYELIVNQTKSSINGQFDALTSQMNTGDETLWSATSPVKQLADTLAAFPLNTMILPVIDKLSADTGKYGALFTSALEPYLLSGGACSSRTIASDAGLGSLDGKTIEGVESLGTALNGLGVMDPLSPKTCGINVGKVVCSSPGDSVCEAGNNLMDLKLQLRTANIFKCWEFVKNGVTCNVMAQNGMGPGGSNGCLVNGAVETREYNCNIDDFASLIQAYYSSALQTTFQDLDSKTGSLKTTISTDLQVLVDTQVIRKITNVADGLTCGFLGDAYQGVLDGLCYGGVWGFQAMSASYVACAVLTIFLVILTFIVWRIAYDNVLANSSDPILKYDA